LTKGGIIKARGFDANQASETGTKEFYLSKSGWKITGTKPNNGSEPSNAIDENVNTVWSTLSKDSTQTVQYPQEINVDMGATQNVKAFTYLPRQDKITAGIADKYIFFTSNDGINWQQATTGEFSNIKSNPIEQLIPLEQPVNCRYFKFAVLHVVSGNGVAVAELGVKVK